MAADETKRPPEPRDDGSVVVAVDFACSAVGEEAFTRADLVVRGISHESVSYDVRIYLDNPDASAATGFDPDQGYAGRITIFGHGGCFGDDGHCTLGNAPTGTQSRAIAFQMPHPLTRQTKRVNITAPLIRTLAAREGRLDTVTLVPTRRDPGRRERSPAVGLFRFGSVSIQTYR